MRRLHCSLAVAVLVGFWAVAACAEPTPATSGPPPLPSVVQWHYTPSGVKYAEIVTGKGPSPEEGQIAVVHFTGWLENGKEFDSSRKRKPFGFKVGARQVIRGWDEGVRGMKTGGKRRLIIPGALGYGPRGVPGMIPPDATLVFDIELLRVVTENPTPPAK